MSAERPFRRGERCLSGAGSAERGGAGDGAVMGKTWRPRVGTLPDPASSLLSVSKRLLGLESEPQIRWCV